MRAPDGQIAQNKKKTTESIILQTRKQYRSAGTTLLLAGQGAQNKGKATRQQLNTTDQNAKTGV